MNKSILIVEDEKILRISLADALKGEGYTVLAVSNGEEALSTMETGAFSLIITDIRLPNVGGMEILRQSLQMSPALVH